MSNFCESLMVPATGLTKPVVSEDEDDEVQEPCVIAADVTVGLTKADILGLELSLEQGEKFGMDEGWAKMERLRDFTKHLTKNMEGKHVMNVMEDLMTSTLRSKF